MRIWVAIALLSLMPGSFAFAENRGICPPLPSGSKNKSAPPVEIADTNVAVKLLAVVSDKGYVCNARVLDNIDKKAGAELVSAVRKWHLQPARKDGRAVPVLVTIEVKAKRDADGKLVVVQPTSSPTS